MKELLANSLGALKNPSQQISVKQSRAFTGSSKLLLTVYLGTIFLFTVGIQVGNIKYISSQPWPFPSSLMIGCQATALTNEITVNKEEMDDVKWFPFEMVNQALNGLSEDLILPPQQTIAHQLIKYSTNQNFVPIKNSSL